MPILLPHLGYCLMRPHWCLRQCPLICASKRSATTRLTSLRQLRGAATQHSGVRRDLENATLHVRARARARAQGRAASSPAWRRHWPARAVRRSTRGATGAGRRHNQTHRVACRPRHRRCRWLLSVDRWSRVSVSSRLTGNGDCCPSACRRNCPVDLPAAGSFPDESSQLAWRRWSGRWRFATTPSTDSEHHLRSAKSVETGLCPGCAPPVIEFPPCPPEEMTSGDRPKPW